MKYVYVLCVEYHDSSDIYGIFYNIKKLLFHFNELVDFFDKQQLGKPSITIYKLPTDEFIGEKFIFQDGYNGNYFSNCGCYELNKEEINQLFKEYY